MAKYYNQTLEKEDEWQDNFPCDFCGKEIENTTSEIYGMSAFNDGSAYSNLGYDDRVACENCCGYIKFNDDDKKLKAYKELIEWLHTCPTHKWEVTAEEDNFVAVSFRIQQEEN